MEKVDSVVLDSQTPFFEQTIQTKLATNKIKIFCFWIIIIFQFPDVLAYCMSKSAIDQFTRCVALGKPGDVKGTDVV